MNLKRMLMLLLVAVMCIGLIACGSSNNDGGGNGDGNGDGEGDGAPVYVTVPAAEDLEDVIRIGLTGIKGQFNPIISDNVYDTYVVDVVFQKLVENDHEGVAIAGPIVEEYSLSDDHKTYTFKLKEGVKFADGTPMTAEDVAFTYTTIAHPDYDGTRGYAVSDLVGYEEYHAGTADTFEGIKVVDERTITFTFKDGKESPANIWCFVYGILSKDYYKFDNWDQFLALNTKPMGSGFYTVKEYLPEEYTQLDRNEDYWDAANKAATKTLLLMHVPKENLLAAMQNGDIDFCQPEAKADYVDEVNRMTGVSLTKYMGNGYTFMAFNLYNEILNDVKVRQALVYALNRPEFILADYGSDELATPGLAPLSPVSWAFPEEGMNDYAFNMEKAAELLAEAGWVKGSDGILEKDGKKFKINWLVYHEATWPGTLSSMAAKNWKDLGVELEILQMDFNSVDDRTFSKGPGTRDFDIFTMGFSLSIDPDPAGGLCDPAADVLGGFNASGYKSEKASQLIEAGKTEFDQDKRAEIYNEWALLMNEELPILVVAYRNEIWAINDRVGNLPILTYRDWPMSAQYMYKLKEGKEHPTK
ncbi:ABC transporter substrate-binding protein [Eubacteriales bacterium OttesenSCG-928-N14]|nr:ABC transporter substrate-binding protein [Eubacteriales bacterium OttesenSCG-928-N14]